MKQNKLLKKYVTVQRIQRSYKYNEYYFYEF